MNQLRSWLYGHGSSSERHNDNNLSILRTADSEVSTNEEQDKKFSGKCKEAILKVIPLSPGDCLECKLVGSGVMLFSGVIVITSAVMGPISQNRLTRLPKFPLEGPRKTLYYAICGGLFIAFEAAGICRLFDLGPFSQPALEKAQK